MKTKFHALFIVILLTLMSAVAFGQLIPSKVPLGTERGAVYGYWQTAPPVTTVKGILFFIHGHGERGNGSSIDLDKISRIGTQKMIYQGKLPTDKFIVISGQYPTTASKMDDKTLDGFITHIQNKFRPEYGPTVDNIYMIGISGGGYTLLNYIVNYSRVKAAIEIAGFGSPSLAYKATKTKLWVIHGEDDRTVPAYRGRDFVNAYNKANPPTQAIFTLIPLYGHEAGVWDRVCSQGRFYEWLLTP